MDIIYKLDNLRGGRAPLYHRYPTQNEPQRAHVEINLETGEVSADWNGEIGNSVPMAVWHHRILQFTVPAEVPGDKLADLLESDDVRVLVGVAPASLRKPTVAYSTQLNSWPIRLCARISSAVIPHIALPEQRVEYHFPGPPPPVGGPPRGPAAQNLA